MVCEENTRIVLVKVISNEGVQKNPFSKWGKLISLLFTWLNCSDSNIKNISSDKKLQVSNREMSSVHNEFMLDFTVHLQRQELPTYQKVASCYAQTIVAAPLNVMLRTSKPVVFILQT